MVIKMNKKKITLTVLILIMIDFIIKYLIRSNFKILDTYTVIKNFFYLTYVKNTGAAFSILENNTLLIIIMSIVLLIYLIYYLTKTKLGKLQNISIILIIAGVIGNLIDRVFLGGVIDYLSFVIFGYYFPIFNLADTYIVIGVFILIGGEVYGKINSSK